MDASDDRARISARRRLIAGGSAVVGLAVVAGAVWLALPSLLKGDPGYAVVRVHYGTDRARIETDQAMAAYGPDRGAMSWGYCDVSIPRDHRMGNLEGPSILKFEFREDPKKHVVLLFAAAMDRDVFLSEVRSEVESADSDDVFVFVHGYNVSFEDAARRTAQMKYDLGFAGPALFFSWPSKATYTGYPADEASIEWATPHLASFLRDVAEETPAETVHVIAHSMGNRGAAAALTEIAATADTPLREKFREVILTAPDIDRDVFVRDIVPELRNLGGRITLYASARDKALLASKEFHQYPRAGELSDAPLILDGVDSIDATAVDSSFVGHSYYAENASVMADLFYVINADPVIPVAERFALEEVVTSEGSYWKFRR